MKLPALLFLLICGTATAQSAKDLMLQSVVKNAVTPGYAKLAGNCRLLSEATGKLDAQPDPAHLEQARACWLEAATAAQELDCFKTGPIVDAGDAAAFYFVKVRSPSIERAIQGDATLQQLGAAAKGLFAMEYLLFPKDALARFSSESKRRHYLSLIAQETEGQAERLEKAWQPPYSPSAARFLTGGQDSLNTLVNQMVMTSESVAVLRFNPDNPEKIPGAASGHSQVLLSAAVDGLHRILGGGLNDYTRHLNPSLADRLDRQFASTLESPSVENCSSLNVLLKVDLPSTLGVTLTFISTDGD